MLIITLLAANVFNWINAIKLFDLFIVYCRLLGQCKEDINLKMKVDQGDS